MRLDFTFRHTLGLSYTQGPLIFHNDELYAPTATRITVTNLQNANAKTMQPHLKRPIREIEVASGGVLMNDGENIMLIDERGKEAGKIRGKEWGKMKMYYRQEEKEWAVVVASEPELYALVACKKLLFYSLAPHMALPFVKIKEHTAPWDDITNLQLSPEFKYRDEILHHKNKYVLACSRDMTIRIFTVEQVEDVKAIQLSGHRSTVINAFWIASPENDNLKIYSVSADGSLFIWKSEGEAGEDMLTWKLESKHYFKQNSKVKCADYHSNGLLVVGFENGVFGLWQMSEFSHLQSLSISQKKITTCTIDPSGEWIAFGSSSLGQLLVWSWRSETYVLKQQSHVHPTNAIAYSPDGNTIASAGQDAKLKLFNTTSGFCYVTFHEHTAPITAVTFAKNVCFSASSDGTVRAFDLVRYRNFRTFTTPEPVQFSCLCTDPSSELVVAGGLDTFEIYIWQTQTGRMIDVISSHAGPISHVSFGSNGKLLTSSWDKSVKVWDLFRRNSKEEEENMKHLYEVLCAVYSPDCKEIATATLDGSLHFWREGEIVGTIDGRKDLLVGRAITDRTSAKTKSLSAHFESICYSSDGASLLASGSSKYVCIYSTSSHTLLKRFEVATNYLMGGMKTFLNSKKMTEAGNIDLIDDQSDNSDLEERLDVSLPGVKSGDFAERRTPPVVRNRSIQFSPTNRSWAVASTEGVLVYSVDDSVTFDPFDLEIDIKPSSIKLLIEKKLYLDALIVAFRLNQPGHLQVAYEAVPSTDIKLIARQLPIIYIDRLLNLISSLLEGGIEAGNSKLRTEDMQLRRSPHLEFHLRWFYWIFSYHGAAMKQQSANFATTFRHATKAISYWRDDLTRICDDNLATIKFLRHQATHTAIDLTSITNMTASNLMAHFE